MKDLMLSASVKAQMFATDLASRARSAVKGDNSERGDVVQTVIIIGIFVVICVVVGGLLMSAMETQGKSLSNCIKGVGNFGEGACQKFTGK